MNKWKTWESAPKKIVSRWDDGEYGRKFLAYTDSGEIEVVQWWQSSRDPEEYQNFIGAHGNAVSFSHWMDMPKPPRGAR